MPNHTAVLKASPVVNEAPLFAMLNRFEECEAVLARNNVGRIGFALQDRVSIVPVHYVYEDGWIYGRTPSGGKLREILRNRRVVFEVDEYSQLFEWRSVVVRGPLYQIQPGTTAADATIHAKAVSLIRRLVPAALTESDPVPFRDQLFRIRVVEMSGRASEPLGGKRTFPGTQKDARATGEAESDAILRRSVERALESITIAPSSHVHLDVFDGVVVLTGTAEDASERTSIERAVLDIPAVLAVVQQLETVFPVTQHVTPAEIAREAIELLRQAPRIADGGIKVVAEYGWLRLEGTVEYQSTHDEVVRRLRAVRGSRGVVDKLRIITSASAVIDQSRG
ncbi:MAG: pyridoxamine 5'-phosphate oxidase family protein [Gemmatimonadaceae bacterium]